MRVFTFILTIVIASIFGDNIGAQVTYTHCDTLAFFGDDWKEFNNYQKAYDAYRLYIESCAYLSNSWERFSDIGEMCYKRNDDLLRFKEYREWLKNVLYLSTDTTYYCVDVDQMIRSFNVSNAPGGHKFKEQLTVLYFLVKTIRCPKAQTYYDSLVIPATWNALYSLWADSVANPVLTPFDSTLPSLEDLDLGILRGNPNDVKKFLDSKYGPILSNIHALENPFSLETKIAFTTREVAAIHFEVFDILGKKVFDGGNKVYDEGENQIVLPGASLPHGELFGRFSASDGTVKTIKLRHK